MGPLSGLRVVEMAGLGPAPFCAMLLSDMGAEVVRIDRIGGSDLGFPLPLEASILGRGRRSIAVDLKAAAGLGIAKRLVETADVLVEGFRPGVMERLGLGPDAMLALNDRLVYGRVTGWGQTGPLAQSAGHDINYIAVTGMLHAIGSADQPVPPLNLLGDFGGGAMFLVSGILCALLERVRSGRGQVVDAAMVEGVASLGSSIFELMASGQWNGRRQANVLDGGAPWYSAYRTRDGAFVTVGAIEDKFYRNLVEAMGLTELRDMPRVSGNWTAIRAVLENAFRQRTRDEWCEVFRGVDACFAPVLTAEEAAHHEHVRARGVFTEAAGLRQPAVAPRFSRTPGSIQGAPPAAGRDTAEILGACGFSPADIRSLADQGVVRIAVDE